MDEEGSLLLLSERAERRHLDSFQEFKIEYLKFRCRLEASAPADYVSYVWFSMFGFLKLVSEYLARVCMLQCQECLRRRCQMAPIQRRIHRDHSSSSLVVVD